MSITEEAVRSLEARAEDAEIKAREACEKLRSFESSNDTLMQERHALKIALEHKEAMQVTLEDELEAEKRLSESLMKTVDELRAAQKAWLCKEAKLETEVQQVTSELNSTKAKHSGLQEAALKVLKSPDTSFDDSSAEIISSLQADLDASKREVFTLKAKFGIIEQENEDLRNQASSLRQDVSSLRELIEEKDGEMAEIMSAMIPVAAGPISNELEDLDVNFGAVASTKGNSLFSEVEDRRVQVENKLKKYEAKFEEMKKMLDFKTKQISKLRVQGVRLASMASCGTESSATIRRLEDLLNSEKDKSTQLLKKVSELEMAAEEKPVLGAPLPRRETVFSRRQTVFPQQPAFGSQADEELKKRLQAQIREKLIADEKISELVRDLRVAEASLNKYKSENFTLRVNLQRFKERTSSAVDEMNSVKPYEAPPVQARTEVLVFTPEPSKKSEKASKIRLNEIKVSGSDFEAAFNANSSGVKNKPTNESQLSDNVFEKSHNDLPEIVIQDFDATWKADKQRKVQFNVDETPTSKKQPKRAAEQEKGEPGSESGEMKVKKVRQTRIIDAGEEAKKIEEQCIQQ